MRGRFRDSYDRKTLTRAAVLGVMALLGGCEVDSFLDPSVVGRWERTPVVLPILDQLDVIDEPSSYTAGLSGVRREDLRADVVEGVLGPGDLLTVTVFELVEQGVESVQTRRVDELGSLRLPVVGVVEVTGLTPSGLEKAIAARLVAQGVLKKPTVSVIVQESRQKTFSVIGEPTLAGTAMGTYNIPHAEFRLLDAMAMARGVGGRIKKIYVIRAVPLQAPNIVDPGAADKRGESSATKPAGQDAQDPALSAGDQPRWVYVHGKWTRVLGPRKTDDSSVTDPTKPAPAAQRVIEIPYDKLLDGDTRYNLVIRPGDVLRVPAPIVGNVFIGGAISRPGAYALPGERELTLKQLVFAAGNLSGVAIPERVDLIRRINDTQEATVRLNLRAIFDGTQPDVFLKPNDTVNIGTNFFATPLAVVRNGFRSSYGFGFVLDRNFGPDVFGPEPVAR